MDDEEQCIDLKWHFLAHFGEEEDTRKQNQNQKKNVFSI